MKEITNVILSDDQKEFIAVFRRFLLFVAEKLPGLGKSDMLFNLAGTGELGGVMLLVAINKTITDLSKQWNNNREIVDRSMTTLDSCIKNNYRSRAATAMVDLINELKLLDLQGMENWGAVVYLHKYIHSDGREEDVNKLMRYIHTLCSWMNPFLS